MCNIKCVSPYQFEGGFSFAERKIACFGNEDLCGSSANPPITCVEIAPLSQKFADTLAHRDFLGSVLALGIKREKTGDIIVFENRAYLICSNDIASFISDNLKCVKHTAVSCNMIKGMPDIKQTMPELTELVISSERVDSLISEVWNISRSESKILCIDEKVFINAMLTVNASKQLSPGDIVSVRGLGRIIYEGVLKATKKGRLRVGVRVFK